MPPTQKPGRSKQDYATPPEFIAAVVERIGHHFALDIAASAENTIAEKFYSEADDALDESKSWVYGEWAWLNPPFGKIAPWVRKASDEADHGVQIAMLVPASVGSNWWSEWVHNRAHVLLLSPRLTFVGHRNPYPKDLALLLYTPYIRGGYDTWRWK